MTEYAPRNEAEAALVAAWPQIEPKIVAAARMQFARSPWAHEADERAHEKAQDAFIKCLTAAREGRWDGRNVRQYVKVVAGNAVFDTLRQQKFAAGKLPDAAPDGDDAGGADDLLAAALVEHETPETALLDAEPDPDAVAVAVCLEMLPAPMRRVLWLHYHHGLTEAQLAETLGTTVPGAKGRLFRARQTFGARVRAERAAMAARDGALARLAGYVRRGRAGDCWPWTAALSSASGEPRMSLYGTSVPARRLLWAGQGRVLAPWQHLRAGCGEQTCMNPAHAVLGRGGRRPEPAPEAAAPAMAIPGFAALGDWRRRLGLTQDEAAALAGCTAAALNKLEDFPRRRRRLLEAMAAAPRPKHAKRRLTDPGVLWLGLRRRIAVAYARYERGPRSRPVAPEEFQRRRLARGLTIGAVSRAAGVSGRTLRRLEAGDLAWGSSARRLVEALEACEAARVAPFDGPGFRARRRALGVPVSVFGPLAGLNRETVQDAERGATVPQTSTRVAMEAALDRLERERAEGSAA